jgi:selenocysteine lyase/cysteine desulfurase
LKELQSVSGLRLFGDLDPERAGMRLGVLPMQLEGLSHFLVAAVLGHEFGVGVRSGCFCAHPYLMKLLGYPEEEALRLRGRILSGDRREMPGMIRASFGLYNSTDDIDQLVNALERIRRGDYKGTYHQEISSGEFSPEGWQVNFDEYFRYEVI